MVHNRKKLIDLFIGNISNAIVHDILEQAIQEEGLSSKYRKELTTSFEIAKKYREKINPVNSSFPEKDIVFVRKKILQKVRNEIELRISKGYTNLDVNVVEKFVDKILKELKVK